MRENGAGRAGPAHLLESLQSLQPGEGGRELCDTLVPDLVLAQRGVQAAGEITRGGHQPAPWKSPDVSLPLTHLGPHLIPQPRTSHSRSLSAPELLRGSLHHSRAPTGQPGHKVLALPGPESLFSSWAPSQVWETSWQPLGPRLYRGILLCDPAALWAAGSNM